jgi:hypothetical protein
MNNLKSLNILRSEERGGLVNILSLTFPKWKSSIDGKSNNKVTVKLTTQVFLNELLF